MLMSEMLVVFGVFLLETRESFELTSRVCLLIEGLYFDDFGVF